MTEWVHSITSRQGSVFSINVYGILREHLYEYSVIIKDWELYIRAPYYLKFSYV